jgi:ribosomal protein L5
MKQMYKGLSDATCDIFGAAGMGAKTIYVFSEAGHAEGMKVRFKQESADEEMFTREIGKLKVPQARKDYLTRKYITNR